MSLPRDDRSHLLSRLRADQSERWLRGEGVRVEHYLHDYPDLARDDLALFDLIVAEVLLREERGDSASLEEYVERFPSLANTLRQQWGLLRQLYHRSVSSKDQTVPDPARVRDLAIGPGLPRIPGFESLELLGRGGMGVVVKARQVGLDRVVAVKLIRSGPLAGNEERDRFRTEARAVARLCHPGVVAIHDLGEFDLCPYFAMEFLPGGTLADWIQREGHLPLRKSAELVRDLARAVHYAHQQQVIHRDLKPANVLLDAQGQVKVADFGLARLLDIELSHTCSGLVLGTPSYMAPEQAEGWTRKVGLACDVWALGAVLYECLTGRPPFKGKSRRETLDLVRSRPALAPSSLRPEVPRALEAICLSCLEKRIEDRCPTAEALADDLDAWLMGRKTRGRRPNPLQRLRVRLGHHASIAGLVLILSMMVGVGEVLNPTVSHFESDQKAIKVGLVRKQPVTLIGRQGRPRSMDWVLNDAVHNLGVDGRFSIESWTTSLLEVVADPGIESYRFRARIRHVRGEKGLVGLYVGRTQFPIYQSMGQFYLDTLFNDLLDEQAAQNKLPLVNPGRIPHAPPGNPLYPSCRLYTGLGSRLGGFSQHQLTNWVRFPPALGGKDAWRDLAIEVRPDAIRVVWNKTEVAGVSSRDSIEDLAKLKWSQLQGKRQELKGIPFPGRFQARGGMGLIVAGGVGAFCEVVVEPLD